MTTLFLVALVIATLVYLAWLGIIIFEHHRRRR